MSPVSISPPGVITIDHVLTILAAVAGRQEMRTGPAKLGSGEGLCYGLVLSGAIRQNISSVFVVDNVLNNTVRNTK